MFHLVCGFVVGRLEETVHIEFTSVSSKLGQGNLVQGSRVRQSDAVRSILSRKTNNAQEEVVHITQIKSLIVIYTRWFLYRVKERDTDS